MRREILNYLKQHNLTDTKKVDSLIVSIFLSYKKIEVRNNLVLLEYLEYSFENKKALTKELLEIILKQEKIIDLEELIQLFEFVISPANRIVNGAVYTPKNIREFIIKSTLKQEKQLFLSNYKIADLSCGCGAFLVDVVKELKEKTSLSYYQIFKDNIYGIDIEEYAIERTKILLTLLAISDGEDENFEFNLIEGNALTFDWSLYIPSFSGFNIIVGNPPYVTVKHMTIETRKQLSTMRTCQIGSPDLYIPFFEIGVENLALNGHLGFITMNSFFKSLNARNLRQYFQERSLEFKIIDFGAEQIFQSRNTYTCICLIKNAIKKNVAYAKIEPKRLEENLKFSQVPYLNLDSYSGWNLFANDLIRKIEQVGTPLGHKYRTSHGLATLKNDLYIFVPTNEYEEFYLLKTKAGKEYLIEKTICMPVVNSNKLSRPATVKALTEQLIFPYTNEDKPSILEEDEFRKSFPKAYKYLIDHKELLATRDKGNGNYQTWYAFGRTQGLEQIKHKMFFPKYSDVIPHYLIHSDKKTYFYNGQAFLGSSVRELKVLRKILETRLFWFYISSTSKPYSANYYSLNGTYIKNFGICNLNNLEVEYVLNETNQQKLDIFFEKKYEVNLEKYFS